MSALVLPDHQAGSRRYEVYRITLSNDNHSKSTSRQGLISLYAILADVTKQQINYHFSSEANVRSSCSEWHKCKWQWLIIMGVHCTQEDSGLGKSITTAKCYEEHSKENTQQLAY